MAHTNRWGGLCGSCPMRLYRLRKLVTAWLKAGLSMPLNHAEPDIKNRRNTFSTTSFFMSPLKVLPSISLSIAPISWRLCSRSRMFRTGIKPYSLNMTFAFSMRSIGSGGDILFLIAPATRLRALFFWGCWG